jgi:hypothetical protein
MTGLIEMDFRAVNYFEIGSSLLSISEDLHSRTVNTGAKAQLEMIQIVLIDVIITDKAEWTRVSYSTPSLSA